MQAIRKAKLEQMRASLPPEFSAADAKEWLQAHYRAPLKALHALEQSGKLVRFKRGLYAFRQGLEPLAAAASLHGASYVSFETALAHYGMIPERAATIMSVVDGRPAVFDTPVGRFEYYGQARPLFASGMSLVFLEDRPCPMASREKALLDTLARQGLLAATLEAEQVLSFVYDALRIEEATLAKLSIRKLRRLAVQYRNHGPRRLVEAIEALHRSRP